jgi:hypothetical protein
VSTEMPGNLAEATGRLLQTLASESLTQGFHSVFLEVWRQLPCD